MNKEEQLLSNLRDVYHKLSWLNKLKMDVALKGYKSSEVHCIEFIGKNTDTNVTKLAKAFYMTRGAMSKATKKLIQKKLIESYQEVDNKKEIYFKLTPKGKEIFDIHEKLHNEFKQRDRAIFAQITQEQFDEIIGLTNKYSQHLDAEINKQKHTTKS
ncbi:MAG: MarR family winged helix-turn-helix transcriptional regulator [Alphaproteobacteria bacterium]